MHPPMSLGRSGACTEPTNFQDPTNSGSPGPFLVLAQGSAGARLTPGLLEVERQPLRTPRKSGSALRGTRHPPRPFFTCPHPGLAGCTQAPRARPRAARIPTAASAPRVASGPRPPARPPPPALHSSSPLEEQPHGEDACRQREHRQHVPGARVAVAVGRALQVGPAHVLRQPEALAPQPAPQEAQDSRRRSRHLTPARRPPPPQPPRQPRPTEPAGKQPRGGARPTATLFRPRVLPAAQPASPAGLASSPPISPSRPLRRRRNPGTLRWGLASARPARLGHAHPFWSRPLTCSLSPAQLVAAAGLTLPRPHPNFGLVSPCWKLSS